MAPGNWLSSYIVLYRSVISLCHIMMRWCDSVNHDQEDMWSTAKSCVLSCMAIIWYFQHLASLVWVTASSWGMWLDHQHSPEQFCQPVLTWNAGQAYSETELNQFGLLKTQNGFLFTLVQKWVEFGGLTPSSGSLMGLHTADAASH